MGPIRGLMALAFLMAPALGMGAEAVPTGPGTVVPASPEAASDPAVSASDQQRAPQPLALRGSRANDAIHALMVIAQGDAEAIAQLSPELFHADVAVLDGEDGDLSRRWSQLVPRAIARLAPGKREDALAALDDLCRRDLVFATDMRDVAIRSEDFIPAVIAMVALAHEGARAFDRGRFADALLVAQLLPELSPSDPAPDPSGEAAESRRLSVALLLSARGGEVDAQAMLVEPGMPRQVGGAAAPTEHRGMAVDWSVQRGWLLALDGAGRVLWQYRVEMDAEVVTGAGAALVRDSAGLRAIDERGTVSTLTPPPGDTRCLAVAGGAAWFATGGRAWRLPLLPGAKPQQFDLGSEPLCPPLVRGGRSLWLTRDEVLLFDLASPVHRIRHFLDAQPGWRLAADRRDAIPSINAPDGTSWRLEPFAQQLADADPVGRARLLTQASRWRDALDALAGAPLEAATPEGRHVAFAAHAGLGPEHVALHADEMAALAQSPDDQAAVWFARFLSEARTDPDLARGHAQALVGFLHGHADGLIAWSPSDLSAPRDAWSHAVDGATLGLALERWLAEPVATRPLDALIPPVSLVMAADVPVTGASGRTLRPGDRPGDHQADEQEDALVLDPQLGQAHRHAGTLIQLDHGRGFTRLTCHDAATRRLRWRHFWAADPSVHSRAMAIRDGCALVSEGPSRLVVIDAATGERRMVAISTGTDLLPSQCRVVSRTRLAMLDQSAPGDGLVMVDAAPAAAGAFEPLVVAAVARHVMLPGCARWMVPVPGWDAALVLLADGRALLYADALSAPLEARLPAALLGEHAPAVTIEGLSADGRLYPWSEARGD